MPVPTCDYLGLDMGSLTSVLWRGERHVLEVSPWEGCHSAS
jgi:hypothetical protein